MAVSTVKPERRNSASSSDDESCVSQNIYIAKSFRIGIINWWNVALTYVPHAFYILCGISFALMFHNLHISEWTKIHMSKRGITDIALEDVSSFILYCKAHLFDITWLKVAVFGLVISFFARRSQPTYLLDFATFDAPDSWKISHDQIVEIMSYQGCYTEESLNFMRRLLERSGTSQATAWPPAIVDCLKTKKPMNSSIEEARKEAETVMFTCVRDALERTKVAPKDIDILIVNCSLFSPTPSLCAMIGNKFGLRSDVKTYNLSGMGCSAGGISIDLAKQLLACNRNSTCLVVSTEIITPNLYTGNERSMLVQNTLFRCGGAAIVLSNRWQDSFRAKYKLLHTIREQNSSEEALHAVYEQEDEIENRGIHLSKQIVTVAGKCLQANLTHLGPLVLPLREQAKVGISIAKRTTCKFLTKLCKANGMGAWAEKNIPQNVKFYVPDFKRGIDHFCIHAGGRAVIDGVEKNLKLLPHHAEPSRHTLYHYGNTSSSSIWYELRFIEDNNDMKRGDRALQVAFGSGFKCNSCVWLRLQ